MNAIASSLKSQIALAEETSLSLITEGPSAAEAFNRCWSDLQTSVEKAIRQDDIDEDTLALAYQVASRVEIIAGRFFELDDTAATISSELKTDLDKVLANLSLEPPSTSQPLGINDEDNTNIDQNHSTALPPYLGPAHAWLLENLHNPYPTREVKLAIAHQTQTNLKNVDNWFIGVRRRIGWNKLRMKQFGNKRSLIVAAAMDAFLPNTTSSNTAASHNVVSTNYVVFMTIKAAAENLFATSKSGLKISGKSHDHSSTETRLKRSRTAYPSPERSQSPESPEPSQQTSSETTPISASQICDRKRRRSSSQSDDSDCSTKPHKRSRIQRLPSGRVICSLPSPAPSSTNEVYDAQSPPASTSPCAALDIVSEKRKRCISDSGSRASKRPHVELTPPSPPASDSGSLVDIAPPSNTWFEETLTGGDIIDGLPSPISLLDLADIGEVNVEPYCYDFSPAFSDVSLRPVSPSTDNHGQSFELAGFSMGVEDISKDNGLGFISFANLPQDANYNQLNFEGFSGTNFHTVGGPYSEPDLPPLDQQFCDPPSFDISSLFSFTETNDWPHFSNIQDSSSLALHPETDKLSVLGNSNILPRLIWKEQSMDSLAAKRERVKLLRDELRLLEADCTA